ncbi:MAG: hypothetical protein ACYDHH_05485 [Solirubrobacteraceae bacterium]
MTGPEPSVQTGQDPNGSPGSVGPEPQAGLRGYFAKAFGGAHLSAVEITEALMHYAVALVLLGVAGFVLYHTIYDLFSAGGNYAFAATQAVNGVLFSIIILEVMRTVLAHFGHGGLQLQPFLIIGTISAVREILSVGAKLSLNGQTLSKSDVHLSLLELGVNAAVVVGLAFALVLIRRLAGMREDDAPLGR